jgi:hypothetical protein
VLQSCAFCLAMGPTVHRILANCKCTDPCCHATFRRSRISRRYTAIDAIDRRPDSRGGAPRNAQYKIEHVVQSTNLFYVTHDFTANSTSPKPLLSTAAKGNRRSVSTGQGRHFKSTKPTDLRTQVFAIIKLFVINMHSETCRNG